MANEDKKDFNAMLHESKDMPKFQTIPYSYSIPSQIPICHCFHYTLSNRVSIG